ncbi:MULTISPECIES: acyltransferase family protein [unclassified Corynebacterium]|uniref:acyltransferase family protein n=1 Tax=unclassified Corynebacterium TaxID=2624378 RepID=UPI002A920EB6|nr:acyltransferase family protein [Corynebacterium sp.]MDY5786536.1 acyltransferase family protein [Corynebacterium sp.]
MGGVAPQNLASSHRLDLDGLRGVAIALVVVFHVFVGRVSGGVDVFLLLSGYFFLGSQLRYALRPDPSLNPWWPLWRTARRLVPALAIVLISVYVLVRTLTPPLMTGDLARQFTASMFYFQNWELMFQDADYAAAGVDTSPLQHLWSMSVQGQFYLVAILFGIAAAALSSLTRISTHAVRTTVIVVLAAATVVSFAWASRFGLMGTPENYYSSFSRAWEMTLGALLALAPAWLRVPARYSAASAAGGLLLIGSTGFLIADSLAFPGPLSLLPLSGAILVILSDPGNLFSRVLASRPATWLGDTAYSLYLWHWPLLIIATQLGGFEVPPAWVGATVIAVSLALAHITHQVIERPLRQHNRRLKRTDSPVKSAIASLRTAPGAGRAAGGVAVTCVVAAVAAVQPMWVLKVDEASGPLDPNRYPGAMAMRGAQVPDLSPMPSLELVSSIYPPIGSDGCMIFMNQDPTDMPGPECVYGDPEAETTVVLLGGSHAEPLGIPLDTLGREHGFKVVPFVRQECPMVLSLDGVVSPECAEWSNRVMDMLPDLNPDLVVSNSTRPGGSAGGAEMSVDLVPDSYLEVWQRLANMGIPFVGLRDNPWIFTPEGDLMDPNLCLLGGGSFEECSMSASDAYGPVDPSAAYLDGTNQMWSVDTSSWYCTDEVCPPTVGNVPVYRDQNHISNAYAASLTPLMWEALRPIFDELEIPHNDEPAAETS